jgi:hypothetical protein
MSPLTDRLTTVVIRLRLLCTLPYAGTELQFYSLSAVRTLEDVMPTPEELRKNAENCAELAAHAADEPNQKRLKRMEKAWESLAETQEWLEGEPSQFRQATSCDEGP